MKNKKIVIIGAGASGLLLKSLINEYYPDFEIFILEKKIIDKKNLNNFFEDNPKYLHPNVFSISFKVLLKKYLNKIYLDIYNLNSISSLFMFFKKISRIDFFKKIISYEKNNIKIISGVNNINFSIKNNLIKNISFKKKNELDVIYPDLVFDGSSSKKYFYSLNEKLGNISTINKEKNKILITFKVNIFDKNNVARIDKIINYSDITFNFQFYDLTIIKYKKIYTFTYVSNMFDLNKAKAQKELENFLIKRKINNYKIGKPIKWIHKNDIFHEIENHYLVNNLLPIGDSFLITDPSNGMGLTSILFQTIYITKKINNLDSKSYFKFSKELFVHLSSNSLKFSKNKNFFIKFLINNKNYFPLYKTIRTFFEIYKSNKHFKNFIDQL
jgi:hypothetical protein